MENEVENEGGPMMTETLREQDAVGASFPAFCKMEGDVGAGAIMGDWGV